MALTVKILDAALWKNNTVKTFLGCVLDFFKYQ